MNHGILAQRPELYTSWPWQLWFDTDNIPPTRAEEYNFVLEESTHFKQRSIALDAASGWVPPWHIFAENFVHHYQIPLMAMDLNPEHLWNFPDHPLIVRMLGDLCGMPFGDQSFDIVFCLSVLEHLPVTYRSRAIEELCRVSRHNIVVTFDDLNLESMAKAFTHYGFDCGKRFDQPGAPLMTEDDKPVCYLIGERT